MPQADLDLSRVPKDVLDRLQQADWNEIHRLLNEYQTLQENVSRLSTSLKTLQDLHQAEEARQITEYNAKLLELERKERAMEKEHAKLLEDLQAKQVQLEVQLRDMAT
jgi:uncharacterized protein YjaG (DUF416 family)